MVEVYVFYRGGTGEVKKRLKAGCLRWERRRWDSLAWR